MPYIVPDDEDAKKNQSQQGGGLNEVPVGQDSGLVVPNDGVQSQTSQSPGAAGGPSSSGQYTNIQKYLSANADQAQPLADKVSGETQGLADLSKTQADTARTQFQSQADAQKVSISDDSLKALQPGTYAPPTGAGNQNLSAGFIQVPGAGTSAPISSYTYLKPDQQQAIAKASKNQYAGPNTIEETGALDEAYGNASKATQLADLSGTESGRYELLHRLVGDTNYNQGQRRLDQALLETNPDARQTISNLQTQVQNVSPYIDQQAGTADAYVPIAKKAVEDQQKQVSGLIKSAYDRDLSNIDSEASFDNQSQSAAYQKLLDLLNSSSTNNEGYNVLTGHNLPSSGSPLVMGDYGVKADPYISKSVADRNSLTNPLERYEIEALDKLIGNNSIGFDSSVAAFNPTVSFNRDKYKNDVLGKLGDYGSKAGISNFLNSNSLQNDQSNLGALSAQDQIAQRLASGGNGNGIWDWSKTTSGIDQGRAQLEAENTLRKQYGLAPLDYNLGTSLSDPNFGANMNSRQIYGAEATQYEALLNALNQAQADQSGKYSSSGFNQYFQGGAPAEATPRPVYHFTDPTTGETSVIPPERVDAINGYQPNPNQAAVDARRSQEQSTPPAGNLATINNQYTSNLTSWMQSLPPSVQNSFQDAFTNPSADQKALLDQYGFFKQFPEYSNYVGSVEQKVGNAPAGDIQSTMDQYHYSYDPNYQLPAHGGSSAATPSTPSPSLPVDPKMIGTANDPFPALTQIGNRFQTLQNQWSENHPYSIYGDAAFDGAQMNREILAAHPEYANYAKSPEYQIAFAGDTNAQLAKAQELNYQYDPSYHLNVPAPSGDVSAYLQNPTPTPSAPPASAYPQVMSNYQKVNDAIEAYRQQTGQNDLTGFYQNNPEYQQFVNSPAWGIANYGLMGKFDLQAPYAQAQNYQYDPNYALPDPVVSSPALAENRSETPIAIDGGTGIRRPSNPRFA